MEETPDPVKKETEEVSPEEKKLEERKKAKLEEIKKISTNAHATIVAFLCF